MQPQYRNARVINVVLHSSRMENVNGRRSNGCHSPEARKRKSDSKFVKAKAFLWATSLSQVGASLLSSHSVHFLKLQCFRFHFVLSSFPFASLPPSSLVHPSSPRRTHDLPGQLGLTEAAPPLALQDVRPVGSHQKEYPEIQRIRLRSRRGRMRQKDGQIEQDDDARVEGILRMAEFGKIGQQRRGRQAYPRLFTSPGGECGGRRGAQCVGKYKPSRYISGGVRKCVHVMFFFCIKSSSWVYEVTVCGLQQNNSDYRKTFYTRFFFVRSHGPVYKITRLVFHSLLRLYYGLVSKARLASRGS